MNGLAHIIVIGNEKGGTGKSTVAMHLIVSLLKLGASVGTIDLDARQATLTQYLKNRFHQKAIRHSLNMPEHIKILSTTDFANDSAYFLEILSRLCVLHDVIVIDTPGSDNQLSRLGHSYADILVTPLNDSLIDLDVLAKVDPNNMKIDSPSHYSEMVWDAKKTRALRGVKTMIEWFVLRNRLSTLHARNKIMMGCLLNKLSKRIGFKLIDGLGERVVYRELFLDGLTLSDLGEDSNIKMNLSHVAARHELRSLIDSLGLLRFAVIK
ncbi:MAG: division plane positioning ATPase MipZ [Rhodospirillaceae bacterium]|jgi:chromosome partitioning protein|nr:division plane positioning ATPase MipZ [Rhodospirillaceae bacterium]